MPYTLLYDQRKHYLKRKKLKKIDLNRAKVQKSFHARASHTAVLDPLLKSKDHDKI